MLIIVLIILSIAFYKISSNRSDSILTNPNLRGLVFYRDYLILTMLPYLYYWHQDRYKNHYILTLLESKDYFLTSSIFATLFIFTFILSYNTLQPALQNSFSKIKNEVNYKTAITLLSFLSWPVFVLVLAISYNFTTGIFGLGKLNYDEVAQIRHSLSHGGKLLALNKIFMKSWVPMISYLFLYLYIGNKNKFNALNKLMLFFSILSGLLASVFFMEKAIVFIYMLGLIGVYIYSGNKIKKRLLIYLIISFLALISIMYILTYGSKIAGFVYLKDIIIHRIATQSVGSVMAIDYFNSHDFKGMAGVSNLWASLLGETFSSPYSDIIKFYVPESAATSGALSSFVTGEAYGLFGLPGVMLSGIIIASWYALLEATKASSALSILFVGLYGLYFSHHYVASAFFPFIWPIGFFYSIFPFFIILMVSLKRKNRLLYRK